MASDKFVVLDTAPTGHTLLMLDATGSYHREVERQMGTSAHFAEIAHVKDYADTFAILPLLAEDPWVFPLFVR